MLLGWGRIGIILGPCNCRWISAFTAPKWVADTPPPVQAQNHSQNRLGRMKLKSHWYVPPQSRRRGAGAVPENTRLTEVITIYEKLTKSKEREDDLDKQQSQFVFRPSSNYFEYFPDEEDSASWKGYAHTTAKESPGDKKPFEESAKVLDFSKFSKILWKNYSYFSAQTGLLQAHSFDGLKWEEPLVEGEVEVKGRVLDLNALLHESKQYCLNIINPTSKDLNYLRSQFGVHDLTIRDIQDQSTGEKVEVFKHYTFLSLKPYMESEMTSTPINAPSTKSSKSTANDMDLNILMFPDHVIIIHYGPHWTGFKDMLGFLNLLCSYGSTPLTPDWVLFSIFIELAQDAKFNVKQLEPKIINLRVNHAAVGGESGNQDQAASELGTVLAKNFQNEFEVYKIHRFIKPKLKVIKLLRFKCDNRLSPFVLSLLFSTKKDFEELLDTLGHFSHILERSQDTCLTLANVKQSEQANNLGKVMKRISEVALLFLPLQAVAGFLGMNIKIPLQDVPTTVPFWAVFFCSSFLCICLYTYSRRVPTTKKTLTAMSLVKRNASSKK